MQNLDMSETVKDRIRARMFEYKDNGVPKEVALNEIREAIFGTGRWSSLAYIRKLKINKLAINNSYKQSLKHSLKMDLCR